MNLCLLGSGKPPRNRYEKDSFWDGKLISWRINWRTIFKKREKDSEGKNQQNAQG
jgi:hypothetical protein